MLLQAPFSTKDDSTRGYCLTVISPGTLNVRRVWFDGYDRFCSKIESLLRENAYVRTTVDDNVARRNRLGVIDLPHPLVFNDEIFKELSAIHCRSFALHPELTIAEGYQI